MDALERSLANLQTDYIDLYQLHAYDVCTSIEEVLRTLNYLIQNGKVRYIAVSNFTAWQLEKTAFIAKNLNLESFICLQPQYNLLCRSTEWDLIPVANDLQLAVIPWSPLAGGWLSGKFKRNETKAVEGSRVDWAEKVGWKATSYTNFSNEHTFILLDKISEIAISLNKTIAQVSLRWLMQKPGVTAPIIGAKNLTQLNDNLGSSTFELSNSQMEELDNLSSIEKPYPWSEFWNYERNRK